MGRVGSVVEVDRWGQVGSKHKEILNYGADYLWGV
jgi:hypothetical protein